MISLPLTSWSSHWTVNYGHPRIRMKNMVYWAECQKDVYLEWWQKALWILATTGVTYFSQNLVGTDVYDPKSGKPTLALLNQFLLVIKRITSECIQKFVQYLIYSQLIEQVILYIFTCSKIVMMKWFILFA